MPYSLFEQPSNISVYINAKIKESWLIVKELGRSISVVEDRLIIFILMDVMFLKGKMNQLYLRVVASFYLSSSVCFRYLGWYHAINKLLRDGAKRDWCVKWHVISRFTSSLSLSTAKACIRKCNLDQMQTDAILYFIDFTVIEDKDNLEM